MCTMVVVATTRNVSSVTATASLLRMPNRMLGAVGLQLVMEGLQADPQDLRRPRLVVAVGAEGPEEQLLGRDEVAVAHDGGPLQRIPELPHISRPGVRGQDLQDLVVHRADVLVVL